MDALGGVPVWLASLSIRDSRGEIIATGEWIRSVGLAFGEALLRRALEGVGDPSRERLFRMNITLCLHRAMTDEEIAGLPPWWHEAPSGMAGGPVESYWIRGVPMAPSARPCKQPGRQTSVPNRPDLWVPIDCGRCSPCRARAALRLEP